MLLDSAYLKHLDTGIDADMCHDMFLGVVGTYLGEIQYSKSSLSNGEGIRPLLPEGPGQKQGTVFHPEEKS